MPRQSESEKLRIKERVRRRDFHECVVCGLDRATHLKRYGQIHDVHRVVPGSEYSSRNGVCVTLCQVCHQAMHNGGNWGWVRSSECDYSGSRAGKLMWALRYDIRDERAWRRREAWGERLRALRTDRSKKISTLAIYASLEESDIEDFEAGRREPSMFELKALARELEVTLDVLAEEEDVPEESWLPDCEKRSKLRAITFCTRDWEEDEMLLTDQAKYVWRSVQNEYDERARIKAASDAACAKRNQEMALRVRGILKAAQPKTGS